MAKNSLRKFSAFNYDFDFVGFGPIFWGGFVLVPFFIAMLIWSLYAPLSSAAIATGEVVLDLNRKSVQHLEGGIVERLLVEEGQNVAAGDALLVVRDLPQRLKIAALNEQIASSHVLRVRLEAEAIGAKRLAFSNIQEGFEVPPSRLKSMQSLQRQLFENHRRTLNIKSRLAKSNQVQLKHEIDGLKAQIDALKTQNVLNNQEITSVSFLIGKGLLEKRRLWLLQNNQADIKGQIGSLTAQVAQKEQLIRGLELEILNSEVELRTSALAELRSNELSLKDLVQQKAELKDELNRSVVVSPASGRVLDLQVHTVGEVLEPGKQLMHIVPNDDRLIIEAKVNPNDIDIVAPGKAVKVLLSAYNSKKVPKIDARVESVSGDALEDQSTGARYFLARVVVDEDIFGSLRDDVSLYPGMPTQVFIVEGERTLANYLVSPIFDAAYRAFREE